MEICIFNTDERKDNKVKIYLSTYKKEPVVIIDFDIKKYNHSINGEWQELSFPESIEINDKLYLTEEKIKKIVVLLDFFYKEQSISHDIWSEIEQLKDIYGNKVSIHLSSVGYHLWFGCETTKIHVKNKNERIVFPQSLDRDFLIQDRLHLNKEDAKKLKNTLLILSKYIILKSKVKGEEKNNTKIIKV